jgi:hypothetical protein
LNRQNGSSGSSFHFPPYRGANLAPIVAWSCEAHSGEPEKAVS